jgi:hypothetical protein
MVKAASKTVLLARANIVNPGFEESLRGRNGLPVRITLLLYFTRGGAELSRFLFRSSTELPPHAIVKGLFRASSFKLGEALLIAIAVQFDSVEAGRGEELVAE